METSIIEKQLLEWKEELAKRVKTKDQAEKVLEETNKAILMLEGGIQAKEILLKKNESSAPQVDKAASSLESEAAPSKK